MIAVILPIETKIFVIWNTTWNWIDNQENAFNLSDDWRNKWEIVNWWTIFGFWSIGIKIWCWFYVLYSIVRYGLISSISNLCFLCFFFRLFFLDNIMSSIRMYSQCTNAMTNRTEEIWVCAFGMFFLFLFPTRSLTLLSCERENDFIQKK